MEAKKESPINRNGTSHSSRAAQHKPVIAVTRSLWCLCGYGTGPENEFWQALYSARVSASPSNSDTRCASQTLKTTLPMSSARRGTPGVAATLGRVK